MCRRPCRSERSSRLRHAPERPIAVPRSIPVKCQFTFSAAVEKYERLNPASQLRHPFPQLAGSILSILVSSDASATKNVHLSDGEQRHSKIAIVFARIDRRTVTGCTRICAMSCGNFPDGSGPAIVDLTIFTCKSVASHLHCATGKHCCALWGRSSSGPTTSVKTSLSTY